MQVFGADYPTPDGTCIRDYIHVSDLVNAHCHALSYLRGGGEPLTLNCGYGRGFSVLQVIEAMRHESGNDFPSNLRPPAWRSGGDRGVGGTDAQSARLAAPRDDLSLIVRHALAWERKLLAQGNARLPSRGLNCPLRPIVEASPKVRRAIGEPPSKARS